MLRTEYLVPERTRTRTSAVRSLPVLGYSGCWREERIPDPVSRRGDYCLLDLQFRVLQDDQCRSRPVNACPRAFSVLIVGVIRERVRVRWHWAVVFAKVLSQCKLSKRPLRQLVKRRLHSPGKTRFDQLVQARPGSFCGLQAVQGGRYGYQQLTGGKPSFPVSLDWKISGLLWTRVWGGASIVPCNPPCNRPTHLASRSLLSHRRTP